uniref:Guided entry of tail-anchored proteins factor 1 n=1 Tax=Trichuris muris TaxID=70415 RepID=A0A5S6QM11_TRIMR
MEVASLPVVVHVFGTLAAFYLSPYYLSPITWLFARATVRRDREEKKIQKRIEIVKKELQEIQMIDQFAEYARTKREFDVLRVRIKQIEDKYQSKLLDQENLCTIIFYAVMLFAIAHCVYKYYGLPILQFPATWFAPFNFILSFPGTRSTAEIAYVSVSFIVGLTLCLTKITSLSYVHL